MAKERESTREFLYSSKDEDLVIMGVLPKSVPPARRRKYLLENIESVIDEYQKLYPLGEIRPLEDLWYRELKVLLPPEELLDRHPNFEDAWMTLLCGDKIHPALLRKVSLGFPCVHGARSSCEHRPWLTSTKSGSQTLPYS